MTTTVTVRIPSALRRFSDGRSEVPVETGGDGATVGDVLGALAESCPGVVDRVIDEAGGVRRHVNVFVDGVNLRDGRGLATAVPSGAEVTILPAVSGG